MYNKYEIIYNNEDDTLEIFKTPSRNPVKINTVKYGIEFHTDINGNTVKIVIPEVSILFGVKSKDIQSFLIFNEWYEWLVVFI